MQVKLPVFIIGFSKNSFETVINKIKFSLKNINNCVSIAFVQLENLDL